MSLFNLARPYIIRKVTFNNPVITFQKHLEILREEKRLEE